MTEIYLVNKKTHKLEFISSNLQYAKERIETEGKNINDYYVLEDIAMRYVSRISYITNSAGEKQCIYNNVDFWARRVHTMNVMETYDDWTVTDFLGNPVDRDRFLIEMNNNKTRISCIDGRPGQVEYNMTVGNEFIALFREECILTEFTTITPLQIAQKLASIIGLVQTGSFREAKMALTMIPHDDFLTTSRIQKYMDLLDAADSIVYATEEGYYYTAPTYIQCPTCHGAKTVNGEECPTCGGTGEIKET